MENQELNKEFQLSNEDASEFLRDLADSIEEGKLSLDGDEWKIYHEISRVPMRIFNDENGTEIGLKLLTKN